MTSAHPVTLTETETEPKRLWRTQYALSELLVDPDGFEVVHDVSPSDAVALRMFLDSGEGIVYVVGHRFFHAFVISEVMRAHGMFAEIMFSTGSEEFVVVSSIGLRAPVGPDVLRAVVTEQLREEIGGVDLSMAPLHGDHYDRTVDRVHAAAQTWTNHLLGDDPEVVMLTSAIVMNAIRAHAEPPAAWWSTPLGRVVAISIGRSTTARAVSRPVASAMLDCTLEDVEMLLTVGALTAADGGEVTVASIIEVALETEG
jgi:hypothetical protein